MKQSPRLSFPKALKQQSASNSRWAKRWFGWDTGELEEEIEFIFFKASTVDDEAHTLDGGPGGVIALEARGDTTVVRVTRAAPAGSWDCVYDEVNEGWLTFFQQLRFYLERNPGRDRRTQHVPAGGEEWFSSEHQLGQVRDDGALVIRTRERVIVSEYD